MTTGHKCDPSSVDGGGWVTHGRVNRFTQAVLDQNLPNIWAAITEIDGCPKCWLWFTMGLAGLINGLAPFNPDFRLALEMRLAAIDAALARGDVDLPPEGLSFE